MSKKYILDTNVFIWAKIEYYQFEFCSDFWNWIIEAHTAEIVFSTKMVLEELLRGRIDVCLKSWVLNELPSSFFLTDKTDQQVMDKYYQLLKWAAEESGCQKKAITAFQAVTCADPFILAYAAQKDYVIVTHEKRRDPKCINKISIPNVASAFQVECINIFDLLRRHASETFKLKK